MKGIENLFLLIALIVVGLIVGGIIDVPDLSFSTVSPDKLYAPRFGSIWCEETTQNTSASISQSWADSTEWNLGLEDNSVWIDIPYLNNHSGHKLKAEYLCTGARCELSNPDASNFQCFDPNDLVIYDVVVAGELKERRQARPNYSPEDFRNNPSAPSSTITAYENQNITVYAACMKTDSLFSEVRQTRAKSINIPFDLIVNKELVRYLDGSQFKEQETLGCTYNSVQLLALQNESLQNQPVIGNLIQTIRNAAGQLISGFNQHITLPSNIPSSMNVGESFNFIYQWIELPAYNNVVVLGNGTKVFREPATNTVYEVEDMTLNSGIQVQVVGNVYANSVQCLFNEECIQQFGSGYYCDVDAGFTCTQNAGYCNYDSDCGSNQYTTINNIPYYIEFACVNHSCSQNQTQLVCNPTKTFPYNNCPSNQPVCTAGGTQCIEQQTPLTACPAQCCLVGDPDHYQKDCPSGYECQTNGTWTGTCVLESSNPFCGDGVCGAGEDPVSCAVDCGGEEETNVCPNFWEQYREVETPLWWGLMGTETTAGCFTADWVYLAVGFVVVIVGLFIVFWKK